MGFPRLEYHIKEENWEVAKFANQHFTLLMNNNKRIEIEAVGTHKIY